jgi:predicted ArsR family transcriptional regulator
MTDLESSLNGVAALAEPVRRDLYLYVAGQAEPVSREQAAEGVGVAAHTAKFHLDKLALEGLLDIEYRRLSGRSGPGAGRPTKLYRRSQREVSVSLPQRQYALAGQLMARAIDVSTREGRPVVEALHQEAELLGQAMATEPSGARDEPHHPGAAQTEPSAGPPDLLGVLAEQGFEPHEEGGRITLGNCPFAALAREHTELVCGMNLALVGAIAEELGESGRSARLDPAPGRCCVVFAPPLPDRGDQGVEH